VVVEVGHIKIAEQNAAIGMWVGSHPSVALWCQLCQFCIEPAIFIEEFFGLVALHPRFQKLYVIGMCGIDKKWHLMRAECPLNL
jgi:hypothetical protein